jgi:hypothetical protein
VSEGSGSSSSSGSGSDSTSGSGSSSGSGSTSTSTSGPQCFFAEKGVGGDEGFDSYYDLAAQFALNPPGTVLPFRFIYDTDDLPDRVIVTDALGTVLLDSGCVGTNFTTPETAGEETVYFLLTAAQSPVHVEVLANCGGTQGTGWHFSMECVAAVPSDNREGNALQLATCPGGALLDKWITRQSGIAGLIARVGSVCYIVTNNVATRDASTFEAVDRFYYSCALCDIDRPPDDCTLCCDVYGFDLIGGGATWDGANFELTKIDGAGSARCEWVAAGAGLATGSPGWLASFTIGAEVAVYFAPFMGNPCPPKSASGWGLYSWNGSGPAPSIGNVYVAPPGCDDYRRGVRRGLLRPGAFTPTSRAQMRYLRASIRSPKPSTPTGAIWRKNRRCSPSISHLASTAVRAATAFGTEGYWTFIADDGSKPTGCSCARIASTRRVLAECLRRLGSGQTPARRERAPPAAALAYRTCSASSARATSLAPRTMTGFAKPLRRRLPAAPAIGRAPTAPPVQRSNSAAGSVGMALRKPPGFTSPCGVTVTAGRWSNCLPTPAIASPSIASARGMTPRARPRALIICTT